ncbi:hypothetical protein MIDIC_110128 [Alphaproteobacteria bacterium]
MGYVLLMKFYIPLTSMLIVDIGVGGAPSKWWICVLYENYQDVCALISKSKLMCNLSSFFNYNGQCIGFYRLTPPKGKTTALSTNLLAKSSKNLVKLLDIGEM